MVAVSGVTPARRHSGGPECVAPEGRRRHDADAGLLWIGPRRPRLGWGKIGENSAAHIEHVWATPCKQMGCPGPVREPPVLRGAFTLFRAGSASGRPRGLGRFPSLPSAQNPDLHKRLIVTANLRARPWGRVSACQGPLGRLSSASIGGCSVSSTATGRRSPGTGHDLEEAAAGMAFRRRRDSDTWHWCRNCSNWPTADFDERPMKPSGGELCNECAAKQRDGSCR